MRDLALGILLIIGVLAGSCVMQQPAEPAEVCTETTPDPTRPELGTVLVCSRT